MMQQNAGGPARIDINVLNQLKSNLKVLENQDVNDLPRIKKNIDHLEAFTIKGLKNKLNDDNKKSQAQISTMKRHFENLQKQIDDLTKKIGSVRKNISEIENQFNDEDMEKDNDFKYKLHAIVDECDLDVHGDKNKKDEPIPDDLDDGAD